MNGEKKKKFWGTWRASVGIFLVLAGVACVALVHLGDGSTIAQKGGATIAEAWQNLFGSASYGINPDEDDVLGDTDASDTLAVAQASTTQDISDASSDRAPAPIASKTKSTAASSAQSSSQSAASSPEAKTGENIFSPTASSTIASTTIAIQSPCAFPSVLASSSQKIIMNEIAWMGSPAASGESATAAASDEWIELKNSSAHDIDVNGWELLDSAGAIKINFADGNTISAHGFLLLARGTSSAVAQIASVHYSGNLSNSGDTFVLLDEQCNVSDFVDASDGWSGGSNTTKQTLERTLDQAGWQTSLPVGGTPGAENSSGVQPVQQSTSTVPIASSTATSSPSGGSSLPIHPGGVEADGSTNGSDTASSSPSINNASTPTSPQATAFCPANHMVIAAIQVAGTSSGNDFIKLYNPTATSIDMSGWRLRKKTSGGTDESVKVLGDGSVVGPSSYFVWANSGNGFAQSIGADVSSTETIAADNSIALFNASGTIVDEVAWGTGTNQYAEGDPFATDPKADQILERIFVNGAIGDSDDNASDFTIH